MTSVENTTEFSLVMQTTSAFALLKSSKYFLISLLFFYIPVYFNYTIICWAALPFFLISLYQFFYTKGIKFILNENEIICQNGLFTTNKIFYEFYRVRDDIQLYRSFFDKLINTMNILLISSDKNDSFSFNIKINGIENSDKIVPLLKQLIHQNRLENNVHTFN